MFASLSVCLIYISNSECGYSFVPFERYLHLVFFFVFSQCLSYCCCCYYDYFYYYYHWHYLMLLLTKTITALFCWCCRYLCAVLRFGRNKAVSDYHTAALQPQTLETATIYNIKKKSRRFMFFLLISAKETNKMKKRRPNERKQKHTKPVVKTFRSQNG